ncbi:hypothetical protein [Burkholderia anthina]|uniref:hypothetical protein n=1 Tax=Burkholderia anthina TaxID=179879 RepID=UPI00158E34FE|nr:hypothetical protein [Burkholderia anthina]
MVPPIYFNFPSTHPTGATIPFDQCAGCSLKIDKSIFCIDKGAAYLRRPMNDAPDDVASSIPPEKTVHWHGRKLLSYLGLSPDGVAYQLHFVRVNT